jgi:hypothetical protein
MSCANCFKFVRFEVFMHRWLWRLRLLGSHKIYTAPRPRRRHSCFKFHHHLHGLGYIWSVSSSRRLCCLLYLICGRPTFHRLTGLYFNILFWIRLSYCDGFAQSIARQRLGKHSRQRILKGKVPSARQRSCNTPRQQSWQQKDVFPMWSVPRLYNKSVFAAERTVIISHVHKSWHLNALCGGNVGF